MKENWKYEVLPPMNVMSLTQKDLALFDYSYDRF